MDASGARELWTVGCSLTFEADDPSLIALQVAPATSAGTIVDERLELRVDAGRGRASVVEVPAQHGGRFHVVSSPPGMVTVEYTASLARGPGRSGAVPGGDPLASREAIEGVRQSRYCPSDSLAGFATTEFADLLGAPGDVVANGVASWVFERLAYVSGVSDALDSAVDTLLAGSGVCRDFAHLTIALCRALGVPARLAAVYAPGISPMDFHAVAEVLTPTGWSVVDATRLAPRSTLVRIATGRDATDTAFASTLRGTVELTASDVHASSDAELPADDHLGAVELA